MRIKTGGGKNPREKEGNYLSQARTAGAGK